MLKTTTLVVLLAALLLPGALIAQSAERDDSSDALDDAAAAPALAAQCGAESGEASVLPTLVSPPGVFLPPPLPTAEYPVCDAAKYFQVPCSECPEACAMGGQVHPCGCELNRCWCPL